MRQKVKTMEKLRFKDDFDARIIYDIKNLYETLMSSSTILDRKQSDVFIDSILEITSSILAGDFSEKGGYVYEIKSRYLAKRAVKYAKVYYYTHSGEYAYLLFYCGIFVNLMDNLEYMLDYSYDANIEARLEECI